MLILLLGACQSRRAVLVRVDFERVIATLPAVSLALPSAFAPTSFDAPSITAHLPAVQTPALLDTLNRRRERARLAIHEQREAVRERLLQARLEPLPELEQRWRAELQAEYDLDAIRTEWQTEWRNAFEKHGRQRFSLLAEMAMLPPDSERFKQLQKQLNELDAHWQKQEEELRAQLATRLQRVEQEIEVRLRARQREFTRQVEQEVDQQMRQQPNLSELYLPPPEQQTIPAQRLAVSGMSILTESIDLRPKAEQHEQRMRDQTERILRQLAREWAQLKGYRLSDSPRARDATDEFIRYLEGRR